MKTQILLLSAALVGAATASAAPRCEPPPVQRWHPRAFRLVDRESGPVDYFRLVEEDGMTFLRAEYRPPLKTVVRGVQVQEGDRARARGLSWSWRAVKLPRGGNECADGKQDSAAVVYVTWKRGLRWYTLKYVWSSVGTPGAVCDRKRNPFVAQDTIVLQSGGAGTWRHEQIDLRAAFRKHFEDGDADAEVPDFMGVGLMSDGDQTNSESSADYGNFALTLDAPCRAR